MVLPDCFRFFGIGGGGLEGFKSRTEVALGAVGFGGGVIPRKGDDALSDCRPARVGSNNSGLGFGSTGLPYISSSET